MSDTGNGSPIEIPDLIDWSSSDDEPSRFITNMAVIAGDSELTLLLFEVLTPYIQAPPREPEKWAEKWVTKLPLHANCHGRFVLTPERCDQLIFLLQQQLSVYWDNQAKRYEEMERQRAAHEARTEVEDEAQANSA